MVAAIAAFAAFHFIRDPESNNIAGWTIWRYLWKFFLHPWKMSHPMGLVAIASFLAISFLIVVSPFLGRVWIKSKMVWLPTVIFGGISAAGFAGAVLIGRSSDERSIGWGLCLLMAAPVLNFIGLLIARVGAPKPDMSQWAAAIPSSFPAEDSSI